MHRESRSDGCDVTAAGSGAACGVVRESRGRVHARRRRRLLAVGSAVLRTLLWTGLGAGIVCGGVALAADPLDEPVRILRNGEATLPLAELLKLYGTLDRDATKVEPAPPVRAAFQRAELVATLLEDALEVQARFDVVVLPEDDAWTVVELLELSEGTHLSGLPALRSGALAVQSGKLVFLTRKHGRYSIDLRFLERATREGRARSARVRVSPEVPAELRVSFAPEVFALTPEPVLQDARGALLLPRAGTFEVGWRTLAEAAPAPQVAEPALSPDPKIVRGHASTVATLEGERITRVAYALRFSGQRTLDFELPAGDVVQQAYVNGRSVPLELEGRTLRLPVAPARPGSEQAEVELVLAQEMPYFLLSGTLEIALPRPAWPTSELTLDVHLPEVFEYAWSGGSLSPAEGGDVGTYVYEIPEPGRRLRFHQYLLRSRRPDVSLKYTVDLTGHYFHR